MKHTLAIIAALMAAPVAAQTTCTSPDNAAQTLLNNYGEHMEGHGYGPDGAGVALFANRETGSWTMLRIGSDGLACIVAAGMEWQVIAPGESA